MPNIQKLIKILEQVIKQNEIKQVRKLITWFKLLKKIINFGFSCGTTINDGDDEVGELVFLPTVKLIES